MREGQLSSFITFSHCFYLIAWIPPSPHPQSTVCNCCLSKYCRFESMWKLLLVCVYLISNVPGRSYPRGEQIRGAGHHQRFSVWPHSDWGNIQWVGTDHTRCDPIAEVWCVFALLQTFSSISPATHSTSEYCTGNLETKCRPNLVRWI